MNDGNPLVAGSALNLYAGVAPSVWSGDATTDPAPDRRGLNLSHHGSNLALGRITVRAGGI